MAIAGPPPTPSCPSCGSYLLAVPGGYACSTCYFVAPDLLPPPARSSEPPPRVQGKVIGFRAWTLDGYKLRSVFATSMHWMIGENEAVCVPGLSTLSKHEAPHPACACGLYAWHNPVVAIGAAANEVFGAVTAWGRIEVHHSGFRAQFAEPVLLAYHPSQPYEHVQRVKAMAGEMGLQCVAAEELGEAAKQFGEPIAVELRPKHAPPPTPMVPGYASGASMSFTSPPPQPPARRSRARYIPPVICLAAYGLEIELFTAHPSVLTALGIVWCALCFTISLHFAFKSR